MKKFMFNRRQGFVLIAIFLITVIATPMTTNAFLVSATNLASNSFSVSFEPDGTGNGDLILEKKVDGIPVVRWLSEKFKGSDINIDDILKDMHFELYQAKDEGNGFALVGNAVATAEIEVVEDGEGNVTGNIVFKNVPYDPDWYAVVETFTPGSLAEELFESVGPQYFYIGPDNQVVGGTGDAGVGFDYKAFYTIVNGYGSRYIKDLLYIGPDGNPLLNGGGQVFYIGVTNTKTMQEYPSFCAHAGSTNFAGDAGLGCKGYMVKSSGREVETIDFMKFLSAYNYIEDKYGDLNENRVITQVITWALLWEGTGSKRGIDIEGVEYQDAFKNANLTPDERAAILDVFYHSDGYYSKASCKGSIVDVVYMLCEIHNENDAHFTTCQPQLVPIYKEESSKTCFNNTPKDQTPADNASEDEFIDEFVHNPGFGLTKTVEGTPISEMMLDGAPLLDAVKYDMSYELYKAAPGAGINPSDYVTAAGLDEEGKISFVLEHELAPGWYAVLEKLAPESQAEKLFEEAQAQYFYIGPNNQLVSGKGVGFDYGELYAIYNGYNTDTKRTNLGIPGLDQNGNVFYISVTNQGTGKEYPSFCAHSDSKSFAGDASYNISGVQCPGYRSTATSDRKIEGIGFEKFLSAYNYIEDKYGKLNDNRSITQAVTWALLHRAEHPGIDVTSDGFKKSNLTAAEQQKVLNILKKSEEGYRGKGSIVDLAYLTCATHGTDEFGLTYCQPQLVPIYKESLDACFDNALKTGTATETSEPTGDAPDAIGFSPAQGQVIMGQEEPLGKSAADALYEAIENGDPIQ